LGEAGAYLFLKTAPISGNEGQKSISLFPESWWRIAKQAATVNITVRAEKDKNPAGRE
jgi:hypothetical protein